MKCFALLILTISLVIATTTAFNSAREPRRVGNFNTKTSHHQQSKFASSGKSAYSSNNNNGNVEILRNDQVMMKDGAYHYDYETANGIQGNEAGVGGVSVQGSNSYISPEGVEVKMSYTADETGYHPVGEHIPQIPDYILRALEYIRTHPSKEQDNYSSAASSNFGKSQNFRSAPKLSTSIAPPHRSAGNSRSNANKNNSKNQYRG